MPQTRLLHVDDRAEVGIELDRASIYAYEAGRVAAPDAAVLWGLARVYGVNIDDLIGTLVGYRGIERLVVPERKQDWKPSSAELKVIARLRKMSPTSRKSCIEFINFQFKRSASRRR